VIGRVVATVVLRLLGRLAAGTQAGWDDQLIAAVKGPTGLLLGLLSFLALLTPIHLSEPARAGVGAVLRVLGIPIGAWFITRVIRFGAEMIELRAVAKAEEEDGGELRARGVRTQVLVLRRVAAILVIVIAVALVLLQFDVVKNIGLSLLASAGIAGVVLGLAAQKSIAGLLAGLQLSITQPVRIGDTVVIEGEFGTVEEINLTYVVVKVWDQRRLIVPMARLLDQPFQNWTKVSPEMSGTVFLYADYSVPVDAVREELSRILTEEGAELWDGKAKGLVVTDVTERTVQLRAMVSAENASKLWDLRCLVRERLVAWLREHDAGRYLPRARISGPEEDAPAAAIE
jgi:small-conductance mechanosensitive channel